ncbi:hypothetical protein DFJ43DRAFT_376598 [Lentinula guzmanii]|uniref:Uncharacterized protein n=1 Tax=Lentinula guzmanii TaxID=2804957 RepID=A0AA38N0M5_9AGAR|nr:hypothetical protein DFJ43DRAFT_376598 [Lentinula guzmanii]
MVSLIPIQALVLLMDSKMNDSLEIIVDCVLDPSDTLRFHSSLAVEPAFWPFGLTCSTKLLGSRAFLQLEGYELDQRNELVRWWVHVMFCVTCVGVGIIGVHRFLDIHRGRSGSCVFAVGSGLDALHLSRGVRSLFCVWVTPYELVGPFRVVGPFRALCIIQTHWKYPWEVFYCLLSKFGRITRPTCRDDDTYIRGLL